MVRRGDLRPYHGTSMSASLDLLSCLLVSPTIPSRKGYIVTIQAMDDISKLNEKLSQKSEALLPVDFVDEKGGELLIQSYGSS